VFQLKPLWKSTIGFIDKRVRGFDALVLCEGKDEVEVIKASMRKLEIKVPGNVGLSYAEGINQLYKLTKFLIVLLKLLRKVKVIGVLLDSEKMSIEERVKSLRDSLKSKGLDAEYERVCDQTFEFRFRDQRSRLILSVSGLWGDLEGLNFDRFTNPWMITWPCSCS